MTGPEHYTEAELNLDAAVEAETRDAERFHLLHAQVHATLAQAAATIDAGTVHVPTAHQAWKAALGEGSDR